MIAFVLLMAATIYPAVAIISWIAKRDQLPEPRDVVVKTAIFGGLAAIPIVLVEGILTVILGLPDDIELIGSIMEAVLMGFVVAALTEEAFKFLVIRGYSARHDAFDEPFDGIVYGVAASLGFALVENVLYVFGGWFTDGMAGGFATAIMRAITAVPGHAACGVIMGTCIGIGRFKPGRGWMLLGFLGAVGFHGAYDAFLFAMYVPWVQDAEFGVLLCIGGFLMVFVLELAIAGLAIARMRRDQSRRIEELWSAAVPGGMESPRADWPLPTPDALGGGQVWPEGDGAMKQVPAGSGGVPGWPMASLIVGGSSAAVIVLSFAVMVTAIAMAPDGEPGEGLAMGVGLAILLGMFAGLTGAVLSIVALVKEPRWKAASILGLICSCGSVLITLTLFLIGLFAD